MFLPHLSQGASSSSPSPPMGMPWAQVPPLHMPWALQNYQQQVQPGVVRFQGSPPPSFPDPSQRPLPLIPAQHAHFQSTHPLVSHKRKQHPDMAAGESECPAAKQFISEDRIAMSLGQMHLDKEYTSHGNQEQETDSSGLVVDMEEAAGSSGQSNAPRLVLSEAVKNLQKEDVLPRKLLQNIRERPNMAVVLWTPPRRVEEQLRRMLLSQKQRDQESSREEQKWDFGAGGLPNSLTPNNTPAAQPPIVMGPPPQAIQVMSIADNNNTSLVNRNALDFGRNEAEIMGEPMNL